MLNFSYNYFNKITPGFLWDIAETPGKVKTHYGLMILEVFMRMVKGTAVVGLTISKKRQKKQQFSAKNPPFVPKITLKSNKWSKY